MKKSPPYASYFFGDAKGGLPNQSYERSLTNYKFVPVNYVHALRQAKQAVGWGDTTADKASLYVINLNELRRLIAQHILH